MSNPNLLNSSHQSYQSPSPSLRWFLSSYVSNARLPCPPPLRQHASPTDSNSLERGFINEKEGGVYTDNEELGHVYGDARTIDLDANGKGKPIRMYPLHSPFLIANLLDVIQKLARIMHCV